MHLSKKETPQPGFEPGIPEGSVFETDAIPDYATAAHCNCFVQSFLKGLLSNKQIKKSCSATILQSNQTFK